eukprot:5647650-Prymnesium_polylepis.1
MCVMRNASDVRGVEDAVSRVGIRAGMLLVASVGGRRCASPGPSTETLGRGLGVRGDVSCIDLVLAPRDGATRWRRGGGVHRVAAGGGPAGVRGGSVKCGAAPMTGRPLWPVSRPVNSTRLSSVVSRRAGVVRRDPRVVADRAPPAGRCRLSAFASSSTSFTVAAAPRKRSVKTPEMLLVECAHRKMKDVRGPTVAACAHAAGITSS